MQNQTYSKNSALTVLKEIQEKGFLNSNIFLQYTQKLNHAFASFLNQTPVASVEAKDCMELMNEVSRKNKAFYSLYQGTLSDLYDWAISGDELTRAQADVQFLRFFQVEAPASVKIKRELLGKVKNMPRLHEKHSLLADFLHTLSNHYVQNHQYNDDPNKSCLSEMGKILNGVAKHTKRLSNEEKVKFSYVADVIQSNAPEFYDEMWEKGFALSTPAKLSVPDIKEAVDACPRQLFINQKRNHSLDWDRE